MKIIVDILERSFGGVVVIEVVGPQDARQDPTLTLSLMINAAAYYNEHHEQTTADT